MEQSEQEKAEREKFLWERYLYEDHSREELAGWARRLRYFRFYRDPGGAAGGGDALTVHLRLGNEAELEDLFRRLEIPLIPIQPEDERMQPGRSYTAEEYARLVDPMRRFPHYREPKWTYIRQTKVFVFVGLSLVIDVHDPESVWTVSEPAIRGAEAIEPLIASVADAIPDIILEPPVDNKHCICPKYYPEFWQA